MTDPQPDAPIVVSESPLFSQLGTLGGQALPFIGGLAMAYGKLDAKEWALWAGLIPLVCSAGWRLWAATHNHDQKVTMAKAVPDSVAVVKAT